MHLATDFHGTMARIAAIQTGHEKLTVECGELEVFQQDLFDVSTNVIADNDVESVALAAIQLMASNHSKVTSDDLRGIAKLRGILKSTKVTTPSIGLAVKSVEEILEKKCPFLALPQDILRKIVMQVSFSSTFNRLRQVSSVLWQRLPLTDLRFSTMAQAAMKGHSQAVILIRRLFCHFLTLERVDEARDLLNCFWLSATDAAKDKLWHDLIEARKIFPVQRLFPEYIPSKLRLTCTSEEQKNELFQIMPHYRMATSLSVKWDHWKGIQKLCSELSLNLRSLSLRFVAVRIAQLEEFLHQQPLTSLTALEKLSLRQYGGDIIQFPRRSQLECLRSLGKLTLSGIAPETHLISTILSLEKLKSLKLKTHFRDFPSLRQLFQCTSLEELELALPNRELTNVMCQEISRLTSLSRFTFSSFGEEGDSCFRTRYTLRSSCRLVNVAFQAKLRNLHVECENHSIDFFEKLLQLPDLRKLDVKFSNPVAFHNFCQALQNVEYQNPIEELTLSRLNAHECKDPERFLCGLAKLPCLAKLRLENVGFPITDRDISFLRNLKKIETLYLHFSYPHGYVDGFSDQGLMQLGDFSTLKNLNVIGPKKITQNGREAFLEAHPDIDYPFWYRR